MQSQRTEFLIVIFCPFINRFGFCMDLVRCCVFFFIFFFTLLVLDFLSYTKYYSCILKPSEKKIMISSGKKLDTQYQKQIFFLHNVHIKHKTETPNGTYSELPANSLVKQISQSQWDSFSMAYFGVNSASLHSCWWVSSAEEYHPSETPSFQTP